MAETKTPPTADDMAMMLFNKLQEKKAEVANAERPVYVTGGNFRFSESVSFSNNHSESASRIIQPAISVLISFI